MLTIILGTDWVANRAEILNMIAADVRNRKQNRILMVPELISHDTERLLCKTAGDTASRFAEVLTFTRLARRVADFDGQTVEQCMDNGGRVIAMASTTQQLRNKLKAYAAMETKPEFLTGLVDAIDEFKRCCISSEDLLCASQRSSGSLAQKLEELSYILDTYDAICQNGKRDPRDQMTWLLEELEEDSFAQEHVFYIDGFPDFTRQHTAILEHLIVNAENVTVSLNCDFPGSTKLGFEKAGETALSLIGFANKNGIPFKIITVSSRNSILHPVHKHLFYGAVENKLAYEHLHLFQSDTVYQECLCIAHKVMNLVQSGCRYRDIAIACADIPTYQNALSMVFDRCHIPLYVTGTEDVLNKPVMTGILCALEAVANNFEQQYVFEYLKSSLSPLDLYTCDKIENYAIAWGITGVRWLEEWTKHPDGLDGKWDETSQNTLTELNLSKEKIVLPLKQLRDDLGRAVKLSQQVEAVYRFLTAVRLDKQLSSMAEEFDRQGDNREAQILNQLWEILLTALEQMHDVLGETVWSTDAFTRLFKLLLSQYDVSTIPPVLDAVTAGPVNVMRCHQTKHLFVMGAVEGKLPQYAGVSGVLSDQERAALRDLGVNLTGGASDGLQIEFSEIYGLFCGADESITVSYSGGQPSFVYRKLSQFTDEQKTPAWDLCTAMGDQLEAGAYLARFEAADIAEELNLTSQYNYVSERKKYQIGSVTKNNIRKLYGDNLMLSASQIDKQAECRLSYFLRYGLRANERKAITVDPAEFGTYVHAVLENTSREIKELGGFQAVTMEYALEIANKHSQAYAKERFDFLDTQRLAYLFNRNGQELNLIVQELWKELHGSKFEATDFELGFGFYGDLPAVQLPNKHLNAQLRGYVDRVDCWKENDKNYFRIVDYKTGKKNFDYCDVFNGIGLQMLLYLFALEQEGSDILGEHAIPAGVQYFPARVPLVSADGSLSDEEAEESREKLWKRKGLLLSDEAVLDAMESTCAPNRLPITRKKDGSVSGDIASSEDFALLKEYLFKRVGKMIDEIASGNITPNPYTRGSSHDACSYCPYGGVCHPDSVEDRRNYMQMKADRFWEEIRKEVSPNG